MATLNLIITEKNDLLLQGTGDPSANADFSVFDLDGEGGDPFSVVCNDSFEIVEHVAGIEYDPEDNDSFWSAREEIFKAISGECPEKPTKEIAERIFDAAAPESIQAVLGKETEREVSYLESGEPVYTEVLRETQCETGQLVVLCEDLAVYLDDVSGYVFINDHESLYCVPHLELVQEFDSTSNSYFYRTKTEAEMTAP